MLHQLCFHFLTIKPTETSLLSGRALLYEALGSQLFEATERAKPQPSIQHTRYRNTAILMACLQEILSHDSAYSDRN